MIYDAGQLNKRVDIIGKVTRTVNGFDKIVTETKYKNIAACIRPTRGREYYEARQITNAANVLITIRYRPNVETSDTVTYRNHVYEIQSVINPYEENESLELYCIEKTRGKSSA